LYSFAAHFLPSLSFAHPFLSLIGKKINYLIYYLLTSSLLLMDIYVDALYNDDDALNKMELINVKINKNTK
jgi:hypothetical protein